MRLRKRFLRLQAKSKLLRLKTDFIRSVENCKKVADFLIEMAWSQNGYANTYAKLCDYLGKQHKLNFDQIKEPKETKNVIFL